MSHRISSIQFKQEECKGVRFFPAFILTFIEESDIMYSKEKKKNLKEGFKRKNLEE